ncbi:hypothetical protein [Haloarchaeobius sp. HME9146]|uniref:helix-turn-helix transcriptional regulator n=1 Tax=Haloarchaeobius sp. HME9146 TaxID=2978732 RepID=UPI0021BF0003|nr:hypothetical protein [Haloarchaeobius sp. HME9146]MCT9098137.1 hypothetical protein [Haloarchaeobius sp. HME9146]
MNQSQQAQPETDNTVTRIEVSADGSANWTIQIRTRLDTDQRVEEYTAFQAQFRNDTARYLGPFRDRISGVVANAADATGREMAVTNFTASTSIQEIPRRWGIVTYTFTWENFAAPGDNELVVGDVFQGGFFIASNDTLQVAAPEDYGVQSVTPAANSKNSGVVTWVGRRDFPDGQPRVVFAPTTADGMTTTGSTPNRNPESSGGLSPAEIGGGLAALVLVGVVALVLYRRQTSEKSATAADSHEADPQEEPATGITEPSSTGPEDDQMPANDSSSPGTAVMTDDERVLDLLDSAGGRVRQAAIADTFDWSASKTSRVIGRMADDGTVEKLQLGRENLVTLPEDED